MKSYIENIISNLSNDPTLKSIEFAEYPSNQNLPITKQLSELEKVQFDKALEIRENTGFSFWESTMSTYLRTEEFSDIFLDKALHHNSMISYHSFDLENKSLIKEFVNEQEHKNIALLSSINTFDSQQRYLPMVDFHLPVSKNNQKIAEKTLEKLGLFNGFLINSGESYHYIGSKTINLDKLIELLAKMIFFAPIIDRNWIAHQLLEKNCALRVTTGNKVKPKIIKKIS